MRFLRASVSSTPAILISSLLCVPLVAAAMAGCGSNSDDESTSGAGANGGGSPNADVTFHKDIEPLLQRSCLGCHRADQIAGFSLEKFDDAKPMAGMMAAQVEAKLMPPFHAQETADCKPRHGWSFDPRLTDEEIALFRAWDDAGAPEGDPADAPPPYAPEDQTLAGADFQLVPTEAGTIAGDNDIFECVVYDPALAQDVWLDGIHIVPGNPKVAHHALMFRIPRTDADGLSGGNERFECFGAPPGELIGAWAPGTRPLELPDGIGMKLTTNDVVVVQMHYHPTSDTTETDKSTIQLRTMAENPSWSFQLALPGNASSAADGLLPDPEDRAEPEFRIPAGSSQHVEEMVFTIPDVPIELPLLLVGTHMHYVGFDARFWIERKTPATGEPAEECLVQTPAWDFNWQRGYMYDAPVAELPTASSGDELHVRCVYNNTMSNRFVQDALSQEGLSAPQDVYLGETTLDEMCLGVVGYLLPN